MKRQRDFRNLLVSLLALFVIVSGEVMGEAPAIDGSGGVIEVMGLACSGVEYYEDGTPEFCRLAREGTLSGQVLAATTGVHFTKEGVFDWCFLPEDTEIQGIPCAKFRFWSAIFWPMHGKKGGTDFHDNKRLSYCELSEAIAIEGHRFKRRATVRFDPDGKLMTE